MPEDPTALPICPYLDELAATLASERLLLLSAETGAGKTTLLPLALLSRLTPDDGRILLLEPRSLAARAAAERIAALRGERLGVSVGLRTRQETVAGPETRLEVVTEGVLTRLLQADPALTEYGAVLFDEFHTRSLQGDLGLALAWASRQVLRPDLKLAVLSATLPADDLRRAYGDWPRIAVPGRAHPVAITHRPPLSPREPLEEGAARLCAEALAAAGAAGGTVLVFLPGWREIRRAHEALRRRLGDSVQVLHLHGRMPPAVQRAVLDPARARGARVVLATNVAETSLTVPGVCAVVDLGRERRVRFSPRTGLNHWETRAISQASAEQRAGRAGRLGPGTCLRWWAEGEARAPYAPPEIAEADLAPLVLETALWGAASPLDLTWVTPPPDAPLAQATGVLRDLGLLGTDGRITPLGREAAGLGLHPRLARMVLSARGTDLVLTAVVIAALLENDEPAGGRDPDFRGRLEAFAGWARGARSEASAGAAERVWEDARRILRRSGQRVPAPCDLDLRPGAAGRLLLAAYPERVARRTRQDDPHTARYLLASGRGALLEGALAREEHVVAADLDGGEQDARILSAAPVERADLEAGQVGTLREVWTLTWRGWRPKATLERKLGAIVFQTRAGKLPPPEELEAGALARLRAKGLGELPWNEQGLRFLARCRFVERWGGQRDWPAFGEDPLLNTTADWLVPFGKWNGDAIWDERTILTALETLLGRERRRALDKLAPETWTLPSGLKKRLDYESGEVPVLSARLQEFFGCRTTPRVCGQPLLLDLLGPSGRTVQRTRDLDGFWDRVYPQVRRELRGRYPRHPWPDDPRTALPTSRAKPRKR